VPEIHWVVVDFAADVEPPGRYVRLRVAVVGIGADDEQVTVRENALPQRDRALIVI